MRRFLIRFSSIFMTGIIMISTTAFAIQENAQVETATALEKQAMQVSADEEGTLTGPADYAVIGRDVAVLNTATNTIYQYDDNNLISSISLADAGIIGIKIAADKGNVYVLGNDFSLSKIEDGKKAEMKFNIADELDSEAISDFKAIDDAIYVSVSAPDGGKTYKFPIDDQGNLISDAEIMSGKIVDSNTYYETKLIEEDGYNCGHTCVINIMDRNSNVIDTITLSSDNLIAGAQYLGKNSDGNYVVRQYDMDLNDHIEETIRTIDHTQNVIGCEAVKENATADLSQIKLIDGTIFNLASGENAIKINEISTEDLTTTANFESKLDSNITNNTQSDIATQAATISRNTIMNNAKAYHVDFRWTCSSSNLAALSNWRKPRYVGSAGTYSYMPYCWGGFSSTSQYKTGMSNNGRVGNINTSTAGHVSNTYGLDCSGYVSRCWGLTSKRSTSTLPNIATKTTYANLKQGDMLDKAGSHVVLFDKSDGSGGYVLYEATKLNSYDRVAHTVRSISSLQNNSYVAYRYNNVS